MELRTVTPTHANPRLITDLPSLIRAEYLEMPGLCLTLSQAARLWHVDRDTCGHALESLAAAGFLHRSGESFVRLGGGRAQA